jgi:hypothetical protein
MVRRGRRSLVGAIRNTPSFSSRSASCLVSKVSRSLVVMSKRMSPREAVETRAVGRFLAEANKRSKAKYRGVLGPGTIQS